MLSIALIGFGEAGQAFVAGWESVGKSPTTPPITIFDIKIQSEANRPRLNEDCRRLQVECCETAGQAVRGKTLVFSMVTADRALEAAQAVAAVVDRGTFYLDCNSCSPSTKVAAAKTIEAAGGHYIDVAVMAPVYPARHRTPLLLAGSEAATVEKLLSAAGMVATIAGDDVGQASSIKMLRSVVIKGMEALMAECVLAARRAGVEEAVLASLQASDPGFDWTARAAYNLERMAAHGKRRAAEMQEVAATLRDLGLPDRMASAAVDWQRQIGDLELGTTQGSLPERADVILKRLTT